LHRIEKQNYWDDFITSYNEVRATNEFNQSFIPAFVVVRQLWFIGLHLDCAHQWGEGYLDSHFLPKELERLRKFDNEFLS